MLIVAVIDALYRLCAASVLVADGPGHVRDVDLLLHESGLHEQLENFKRLSFVDLNFDSVTRVAPATSLTKLQGIWLPTTVQRADGVQGNGPLHGPMRRLGCLLLADAPVAADATCCRLLGIDPSRIGHLRMASPLGNLDVSHIEQRAESVESIAQQFQLLPQFSHLRG